jgi:hypothetical protein
MQPMLWTVRICKNDGNRVSTRDVPYPTKKLAYAAVMTARKAAGFNQITRDGHTYVVFEK